MTTPAYPSHSKPMKPSMFTIYNLLQLLNAKCKSPHLLYVQLSRSCAYESVPLQELKRRINSTIVELCTVFQCFSRSFFSMVTTRWLSESRLTPSFVYMCSVNPKCYRYRCDRPGYWQYGLIFCISFSGKWCHL